jgi:RNA polymerase sigma-70 factor, ECF subfamily
VSATKGEADADDAGPDAGPAVSPFDDERPVSDAEFVAAYNELRKRARALKRDYDLPTLDPTALVHEAFLRLAASDTFRAKSRAHLMATLAKAMEFVILDAARYKLRARRGGSSRPIPLDGVIHGPSVDPRDVLVIHLALRELAADYPAEVRVLRLEYFGGLSHDEAAEVLGVSSRTVGRLMKRAKALVRKALSSRPPGRLPDV